MAIPAPESQSGSQTPDLHNDLYLINSDMDSETLDTQPTARVTPVHHIPLDSTLSSVAPTFKTTRRNSPTGGFVTPPTTLHEAGMILGEDLQNLVSLSAKVTPSNQLDVL